MEVGGMRRSRNQIRAGAIGTAWLWGKIGKLLRGLQRIELGRRGAPVRYSLEVDFTGFLNLPKGNLPQEKR